SVLGKLLVDRLEEEPPPPLGVPRRSRGQPCGGRGGRSRRRRPPTQPREDLVQGTDRELIELVAEERDPVPQDGARVREAVAARALQEDVRDGGSDALEGVEERVLRRALEVEARVEVPVRPGEDLSHFLQDRSLLLALARPERRRGPRDP